MASANASQETATALGRVWGWLMASPKGLREKVFDICRITKKIGQDDPRRVIHSLKVGLALSLVSLFYYYEPLYDKLDLNAILAVLTMVLVFEFTVGATLGKGLNRAVATLIGAALGVGAHHMARFSGRIVEPILLSLFMFLFAAIATFIRFFPKIKARYDYGLLVFLLTFSLISVSGFREDKLLVMAHQRLLTIFLGASICVIISIFIRPVWAGKDLHNLIALNLEKLGNSLQAFGGEYFKTSKEGDSKDNNSSLEGYKSVINSKSAEESLANFAGWEPRHGKFQFRHPWHQYLKIGTLSRQCASRMEALNGSLNLDFQAPPEIQSMIQEGCSKASLESGDALKELALAVKAMTWPSLADTHVANSKVAIQSLKSLLQSRLWPETEFLSAISAGVVTSLLSDIVDCIEKIADSVKELASLAHFEIVDPNKPPALELLNIRIV